MNPLGGRISRLPSVARNDSGSTVAADNNRPTTCHFERSGSTAQSRNPFSSKPPQRIPPPRNVTREPSPCHTGTTGSLTIEQATLMTIGKVIFLGMFIRPLSSYDSPIFDNEYRIALRVNDSDYHYLV